MIKGIRCGAAIILLCLPTAAHALEYSADGVFHGNRGAMGTNKIYVSHGKVRIQPVGDAAYEIFDEAKQTDDIVVPAKKLILAQGLHTGQVRGVRYNVGPNLCSKVSTPSAPATCKKIGLDKIDGRVVEKWEFSRNARRQIITSTIWIDRSLDAVVKVVREGKVTYELLNVHLGPQAASLFVIPAGFQTKQMLDPK